MNSFRLIAAASVAMFAVQAPASAVVSATSTVTGSAGNWVHSFTVFNNLSGTNILYFFGVSMPAGRNILVSPTSWDPDQHLSWSNESSGGSSILYNNNWITGLASSVPAGGSLGGFTVLDTGTTASTNIPFFAVAFGDGYTGPECFLCGSNPGFEGMVSSVTTEVPEPASWAMLIAGFGLTGAMMRRRRRTGAALA